MARKKYEQGKHPNTLANLIHEGRPRKYDSKKKTRTVTVTDEGWHGFDQLVGEYGFSNKSDFIEKIGRGLVKIEISA